MHQRLGIGGICVKIERQLVDSEEFRRDEQRTSCSGRVIRNARRVAHPEFRRCCRHCKDGSLDSLVIFL